MAQSTLWKRGVAFASSVDVIDDTSRELGKVDVDSMPSNITYDLLSDSSREVGNVQVTNTVDTDLEALPGIEHGQTSTGAGSPAQLNGGESVAVPDAGTLRVVNPTGSGGTVYVGGPSTDSTTGYPLPEGESLPLKTDDVTNVYVDASTSIDVGWVVETK